MEQYIPKDALVAEIEKRIVEYKDMKIDSSYYEGMVASLEFFRDEFINTLEVKEVDLELITGWFDHIAQIADDRMTLTNQRMTDAHALDEIKCLAKNSSEFITKQYKAQKGE